MGSNYTFITGVRAFEVKIVVDGGKEEELKCIVIADGFTDCVEIMNERMHELGLTPSALESIQSHPRIMLTKKALEALGDVIW